MDVAVETATHKPSEQLAMRWKFHLHIQLKPRERKHRDEDAECFSPREKICRCATEFVRDFLL
jgi:hypothetical protein